MQNEQQTKFIPRTQMQSILDNAPQGVDKKALIDKFVSGGFVVEGVNEPKPNLAQDIGKALIKAPTDLIGAGFAGAGALGAYAGKKLVGQDTTLFQEYANQTQQVQESGANAIVQPLTGEKIRPAQNVEQLAGDVIQTGALAAPGVGLVKGAATGAALMGGQSLSENQSALDVAKNTLLGAGIGGALGVTIPALEKLTASLGSKLPELATKAGDSITPDPASIMQRVLRVTKGQQAKFEQNYGTSIGQYAVDRGLIGTQEKVANDLATRFTTSIKAADDALASLPGKYQPEPVKTALQELYQKKLATSAPGATDPELNLVKELMNKFDNVGLDMSEINQAKRLFERNVKLDFVKTNNPEGVKLSNNIDQAIREWQFAQAERLGLKNLPEINKETRMAKELLNSLEREASGKAGNNAISLTDWIVLADGGAMNVAAFLAKRGFSSDAAQAFVAKYFAPKAKVGLPTAKMEAPQIDATVQSYFDFLKKTGAISQGTGKKSTQQILRKESPLPETIPQKTNVARKSRGKLISDEAVAKARAVLNKSGKPTEYRTLGITTEELQAVATIGARYIEDGVRTAVELGERLAKEGIKLTKAQLDKLFIQAQSLQKGARLDMNKIDEAGQFVSMFKEGKFSSPEMARDARKFITDNGLDYKKTLTDKEAYQLLNSVVSLRKDLRQTLSIPKELQPLAEEAKKYKSAEEFIKNQQVFYHGTHKGNTFEKFDLSKSGTGAATNYINQGNQIYVTSNKDAAKWFSKEVNDKYGLRTGTIDYSKPKQVGSILEFYLPKNAKVKVVDNMPMNEAEAKAILDKAKKEGYDAITFEDKAWNTIEGDPSVSKMFKDGKAPDTTIILNDKNLVSKQQLIDLYNKVNGKN